MGGGEELTQEGDEVECVDVWESLFEGLIKGD